MIFVVFLVITTIIYFKWKKFIKAQKEDIIITYIATLIPFLAPHLFATSIILQLLVGLKITHCIMKLFNSKDKIKYILLATVIVLIYNRFNWAIAITTEAYITYFIGVIYILSLVRHPDKPIISNYNLRGINNLIHLNKFKHKQHNQNTPNTHKYNRLKELPIDHKNGYIIKDGPDVQRLLQCVGPDKILYLLVKHNKHDHAFKLSKMLNNTKIVQTFNITTPIPNYEKIAKHIIKLLGTQNVILSLASLKPLTTFNYDILHIKLIENFKPTKYYLIILLDSSDDIQIDEIIQIPITIKHTNKNNLSRNIKSAQFSFKSNDVFSYRRPRFSSKIKNLFTTKDIKNEFNYIVENARAGKGCKALLIGPPGSGKTMFAECVANELNKNIIQFDAGKILSKWYGESEQKLQKFIDAVKQIDDAVILIDEFDKLFTQQSSVSADFHIAAIINTWLDTQTNKIIIGTTNNLGVLPPDMYRLGRWDIHIVIPYPNKYLQQKLWVHYFKKYHNKILRNTPKFVVGLSPATIQYICKRAKSVNDIYSLITREKFISNKTLNLGGDLHYASNA